MYLVHEVRVMCVCMRACTKGLTNKCFLTNVIYSLQLYVMCMGGGGGGGGGGGVQSSLRQCQCLHVLFLI